MHELSAASVLCFPIAFMDTEAAEVLGGAWTQRTTMIEALQRRLGKGMACGLGGYWGQGRARASVARA